MEGRSPFPLGRSVALTTLTVVVVLLLVPLPKGFLGLWQGQLLDFGHIPLFGGLVFSLWIGFGPPLGRALLIATAVAGGVEIVQPWVGRQGAWLDFLYGCLGALAAACVVRAYENRHSFARFVAYSLLAIALPTWPFVRVVPYAADTVEGRWDFPVLANFKGKRELLRWECAQVSLKLVSEGAGLEFLPGTEEYSSATMRPAVSDFTGYEWLCCEFRVEDAPVDLVISLRTGTHGDAGTTHAQVEGHYGVGSHTIRLDLALLAARAHPEPLDLSDIRSVQFFIVALRESRVVTLSRIWLERP